MFLADPPSLSEGGWGVKQQTDGLGMAERDFLDTLLETGERPGAEVRVAEARVTRAE